MPVNHVGAPPCSIPFPCHVSACFSPDSEMVVLITPEHHLRMVEAATGRELARFEGPELRSPIAALASAVDELPHPDLQRADNRR